MPSDVNVPERASAVETWKEITGNSYEAAVLRREAYDRWFHICTCGHNHKCNGVWEMECPDCDCTAYDHISGKPDHPCNPLSADDPRCGYIRSQEHQRVRATLEKVQERLEGQAEKERRMDGVNLSMAHAEGIAQAVESLEEDPEQPALSEETS